MKHVKCAAAACNALHVLLEAAAASCFLRRNTERVPRQTLY